jgi:hypothetical protein
MCSICFAMGHRLWNYLPGMALLGKSIVHNSVLDLTTLMYFSCIFLRVGLEFFFHVQYVNVDGLLSS